MPRTGILWRFGRDRRGATAIIFALTLIPILGLVGSAIDYARAYMVRSRLQNALDSAILAAGATPSLTDKERIDFAKKVFTANYDGVMGVDATPNINITEDGIIKGSVDADLPSSILGIIGIPKMDVGTVAEAKIVSATSGEVVLVLDYSGSMEDKGKYKAMRDAAIKLVDTLSNNGKNDKVKFALVPFSGEVYTTLPKAYVVDQDGSGDWTNCTADRRYPYNTRETTPTADDDTKWGFECDDDDDDDDRGRRRRRHDDRDDRNSCRRVYDMCSNYPDRDLVIRPLSNDFGAIKEQLRDMRPYNLTHIALGLEFGWHVISPNAPFSQGVAYRTEGMLKAIVLLTDGEQTSDGWGSHNSHSVSDAEDNLETLCEAVKGDDVMVMTVAFDLDDRETKERLQDCATSRQDYFDADDNDDLAAAFDAITSQLVARLHLSK